MKQTEANKDRDNYFSIIIPVHNKLPHLDRSIHSVLNQSYPNYEIILIDDASNDGSSEKLESFVHDKIRLFKRIVPGPGGYAARNLGIEEALHDWICFLDADDEWTSEVLEVLNSKINQEPDLTLIGWGWHVIDGDKKINTFSYRNRSLPQKYFTLNDYLNGPSPFYTCAVAMKKDLIVKAGLFPAGKCKRGGDVDTWIRYLLISKNNLWVNKLMTIYYRDSVNMVTKTIDDDLPYSLQTLNEIYNETENSALKKSIKNYRTNKIYNSVLRNVRNGKRLNLTALKRMDYTSAKTYYLILKILGNTLKRLNK